MGTTITRSNLHKSPRYRSNQKVPLVTTGTRSRVWHRFKFNGTKVRGTYNRSRMCFCRWYKFRDIKWIDVVVSNKFRRT